MAVVFAGRRDPTLEALAEENGLAVRTTVSGVTKYLVLTDVRYEETAKVLDAHDRGLPVLSPEEFRALFVKPPPRYLADEPLPPSSNEQLAQFYLNDHFAFLRETFEREILTRLKFRSAPNCAQRMIVATREQARLIDDTKAYHNLFSLVHDVLFQTPEFKQQKSDFDRGENRARQLEPIFRRTLRGRRDRYLDVGCNEGGITEAVGRLLGPCVQVTGCDIYEPHRPVSFRFVKIAEDSRLPFPDSSQDVVSAFMVLHHVRELEVMLREIRRVLRHGGYFVIREHDCEPKELALLLDLMHAFYAMVWSDPPEMASFTTHFSHYQSKAAMLAEIMRAGFQTVYSDAPRGAWRYYYAVFRKP